MDFVEFLVSLGWRGILMAVVVLLVFYILFTFLSINRLRRGSPPMPELSPGEIRNAVQSYTAIQEPEPPGLEAPEIPADAAPRPARSRARKPEPAFVQNEPSAENFDPARMTMLEQDMAQLRREIGGLRAEMRALREERGETGKARTRDTSPFYSDAMQLAMQGRDAADISVLCGISRAEAELLVALAKDTGRALD